MERFSLVSIQIRGLSPDVALTLMIMGLKSRPFLGNLCKKKSPATLEKLKGGLLDSYIWKRWPCLGSKCVENPKKKQSKRKEKIENGWNQGRSRSDRPLPWSRYNNHTPLMESRSRVLEEAYSVKLTHLPAKNRPPPGVDKSKYCHYHQVVMHDTEECNTLKDKIKRLIQKGHLHKFVKDKDHSCNHEHEKERSQERNKPLKHAKGTHLKLSCEKWLTQ